MVHGAVNFKQEGSHFQKQLLSNFLPIAVDYSVDEILLATSLVLNFCSSEYKEQRVII